MASYRVLYWQNIPSQVKAWDDFDEVSVELAEAFMVGIDREAHRQGLTGADDYLAQWKWGDEEQRDGEPVEVANAVKHELEAAGGPGGA